MIDELRERREQVERLQSARIAYERAVESARRWDRSLKKCIVLIALAIGAVALPFAIYWATR